MHGQNYTSLVFARIGLYIDAVTNMKQPVFFVFPKCEADRKKEQELLCLSLLSNKDIC